MSMMLEEIREQPEILANLVLHPPGAIARLTRRFGKRRPEIAVIVARGTSDNAALFGRYVFEITLGLPTILAAPSVTTLYKRHAIPKNALVIGISQSGESTDVNASVEAAKEQGAFCLAITNHAGSALAGLADEVLLTEAGIERSVAATKTYTAQMMVLYWIAKALGGPITGSDLRAVVDEVSACLEDTSGAEHLAEHFRELSHTAVLGRGINYCNGLELGLKLMETSYVVACGFSGADFAHGPIAMVQDGFPIFAFCPSGPTFAQTGLLLARLSDAWAHTVVIGPQECVKDVFARHRVPVEYPRPRTPGAPADLFSPIPLIVPGQCFAAELSAAKGLDPDKPRLLSKVTQTL